jgi:hypothetical protein
MTALVLTLSHVALAAVSAAVSWIVAHRSMIVKVLDGLDAVKGALPATGAPLPQGKRPFTP